MDLAVLDGHNEILDYLLKTIFDMLAVEMKFSHNVNITWSEGLGI